MIVGITISRGSFMFVLSQSCVKVFAGLTNVESQTVVAFEKLGSSLPLTLFSKDRNVGVGGRA